MNNSLLDYFESSSEQYAPEDLDILTDETYETVYNGYDFDEPEENRVFPPVFAEGYGKVAKIVFLDNRVSRKSKALYAYLAAHADKNNTCFPSRDKICADLVINNNSLSKLLKPLIDYRYIKIEKEPTKGLKKQAKVHANFHNVYYLLSKPDLNLMGIFGYCKNVCQNVIEGGIYNGGYGYISRSVMVSDCLSITDKLIYSFVAATADYKTGISPLNKQAICMYLNAMSEDTVERAVNHLVKFECIKKIHASPVSYAINFNCTMEPAPF